VVENHRAFGQSREPYLAPVLAGITVDGGAEQVAHPYQQVTGKDWGPQQAIAHYQGVGGKVVVTHQIVERGPLAQIPVHLDPARRAPGHHRRQLT
jgi:hypothetical protein